MTAHEAKALEFPVVIHRITWNAWGSGARCTRRDQGRESYQLTGLGTFMTHDGACFRW